MLADDARATEESRAGVRKVVRQQNEGSGGEAFATHHLVLLAAAPRRAVVLRSLRREL